MHLRSFRNTDRVWRESARPRWSAWAIQLGAILALAGCAELEEANPFRPTPQPPASADAEISTNGNAALRRTGCAGLRTIVLIGPSPATS